MLDVVLSVLPLSLLLLLRDLSHAVVCLLCCLLVSLFAADGCCPCCCLWKLIPDLPKNISSNVTKMHGVKVYVTDRCTGCRTCVENVCFANAIHMSGNRAAISEECRGCGRCVDVCPQDAILLVVDREIDYVSQNIERIEKIVDVT